MFEPKQQRWRSMLAQLLLTGGNQPRSGLAGTVTVTAPPLLPLPPRTSTQRMNRILSMYCPILLGDLRVVLTSSFFRTCLTAGEQLVLGLSEPTDCVSQIP